MATILEKEQITLSQAEKNHQIGMVEKILRIVPPGASVSLEGPPIYLNEKWGVNHAFGYNFLLNFAHGLLSRRNARLLHSVLVDDYTVELLLSAEEYLSRIEPRVDQVARETNFVPGAQQLMDEIAGRGVRRLDGRSITLITQSGRVACAVLDAVFQETKATDFNIVIHPIQFKHEQEEMRAVLQAARGNLPATFVNIFFKKQSINKVYITTPEGRTERVGLL